MNLENMVPVGKYIQRFNELTNQTLPCGDIYQSSGLPTHIKKRHPDQLGNIALIPQVIASPDYIGKNPNEPDSIELVKQFDNHVMVCVKLDVQQNYLYVATVFDLKPIKLEKRIRTGRLKRY